MLDESTLQAIAQSGNGKYYRASADGSELQSLLSEIDNLQKDQLQSRFETTLIERYQIFLGIAIVLFVFSGLIPDRLMKSSSPSWATRIKNKVRVQPDSTSP
jgi:hypothetical protein